MDKNENKKSGKKEFNIHETTGQRIIDLTSYINPKMVHSDPNGSYTGTTADTFYNGEYEEPVQDADDL